MAILKIKQIIEDLEKNTSQQIGTVIKAMSGTAAVATTAVAAGTAAYAGTSFTFSAAQLRGLFNRVEGTATDLDLAGTGLGTSGNAYSWGAGILKPARVIINGRVGTIGTCAQINPPIGTQALSTYCKYLISSGFGSSGTITAGVQAATSTAALLPDLPANHVAVGFIEYKTGATAVIWRTTEIGDAGTCTPFCDGGGAATLGTSLVNGAIVGVNVSGVTQLGSMPFLQ